MNTIFKSVVVIGLFVCTVDHSVQAYAVPVQWTVASGGNGHYYERIDQTDLSFGQAEADAAALTFDSQPGHLVILDTSDYTAERDFVFNNIYSPDVISSEVYWLGAYLPADSNTWSWIDGSTVPSSISNGWAVDHNEGPGDEGGCFFNTSSDTVWDYIATDSSNLAAGYIVEFDSVPVPLRGDFNNDGHVNAADIKALELALTNLPAYESEYGVSYAELLNICNLPGDEGSFNNSDLQALLAYIDAGSGSADPVPEPSTIALLTLGAVGLLFARRRFASGPVRC